MENQQNCMKIATSIMHKQYKKWEIIIKSTVNYIILKVVTNAADISYFLISYAHNKQNEKKVHDVLKDENCLLSILW